MKRYYQKISIFLIFIATLALPVFAQSAIDPDEWESKLDDSRAYDQIKARFKDALAVYDYPFIFRSLQKDLEEKPVWTKEEPVYQHLLKALHILNERFFHFEKEMAMAGAKEMDRNKFLGSYPTGLFQFPCPNRVCFKEDFEVRYDDLESLPNSQSEDFLYRIKTVNHLLTDFKKPALEGTLKAIQKADRRWEIFMKNGRSQYPWEAAFNGWAIGGGSIQFPPTEQWILLHPELGVEVSTDGLKAKETLAVDLLGYVWYRFPDSNDPDKDLQWRGISAIASLRDDIPPGIGFMAHYDRFTLGITWHDEDADGRWFDQEPYIMMGVDLFRFAEEKASVFQKQLKNRKGLFGE